MAYVFPGHTQFLDAAADALKASHAAKDDARRLPAISAIASLVAQACAMDTPHPDTIRRAKEMRDGLEVALKAADAMIGVIPVPATVATVADLSSPPKKK